jgi:NMD protein affecting ribosome stability and mRNA decay
MVNARSRNNVPTRRPRRDRLIKEFDHDTYKTRAKMPEPASCRDCGAVFHKGRWQWIETPLGAHQALCPACHRIHDRYPGGYLTLSGEFLGGHRDEILHLARNTEAREKAEHPLRRIMAIEDQDKDVLITTTTMEMARSIGDALHHAYKGELDYRYTDESNILRVSWRR